MRTTTALALALLLITRCAAEQRAEVPAEATGPSASVGAASAETASSDTAATSIASNETTTDQLANENQQAGTWTGQIKVGQPVSMFNYVGAESGDFAPMRFANDSEVGKQILAACGNDDSCEFTGVVEWLDEPPPPDASAIGRIVRVDSAKRVSSTP